MPKFSATKPNKGGAKRNVTNENCAKAATFSGDERSPLCAAAEIAKGKITAVPAPKNTKRVLKWRFVAEAGVGTLQCDLTLKE